MNNTNRRWIYNVAVRVANNQPTKGLLARLNKSLVKEHCREVSVDEINKIADCILERLHRWEKFILRSQDAYRNTLFYWAPNPDAPKGAWEKESKGAKIFAMEAWRIDETIKEIFAIDPFAATMILPVDPENPDHPIESIFDECVGKLEG